MDADPILLSRLQFALTIGFHYLFPPLSIGLAALMVLIEGRYLTTGDRTFEVMARFWTKVFALTFAMGVATGVVMAFQFGTNWAAFSRFVGDVFGAVLAAEGIFAFFLEAGFLAVVVFGWDRVSPRVHFFATIMLFIGTVFSAFWIVVANSWQQVPVGHQLVGVGTNLHAEIVNFWSIVLSPTALLRFCHVILGAFILGGFFMMSVSAYYLLKQRHKEFARRSFKIALPFTAVLSLLQLVSGHSQAVGIARTQPAKLAAFEGHFRTSETGTPLYVFGFPDEEQERVVGGIAVPGLLSLLVHGDAGKPVTALDDPKIIPSPHTLESDKTIRDYWPPVNLSFQMYHLMVALGLFFIVLTLAAMFLSWRGILFQRRWILWIFVFAVIGAMAANQAGWAAAEIGRQPWAVYGLLKTADSVSKGVSGHEVAGSMVLFGLLYFSLFLVWLFVLDSKIRHGPEHVELVPKEPGDERWSDVATRRADAASPDSFTDAHVNGSRTEPREDDNV